MVKISTQKFVHDCIVKSTELDVYARIMERFQETNVSTDADWQREFTHFYRVRRPVEWLAGYYRIFQQMKSNKKVAISDILFALDEINSKRNVVELSFASKMLATIRPEMPIWDSLVRKNLDLPEVPSPSTPERIERAIQIYGMLESKMKNLLASDSIRAEIRKFDDMLPDYSHISPMKKLDFLVWASSGESL